MTLLSYDSVSNTCIITGTTCYGVSKIYYRGHSDNHFRLYDVMPKKKLFGSDPYPILMNYRFFNIQRTYSRMAVSKKGPIYFLTLHGVF